MPYLHAAGRRLEYEWVGQGQDDAATLVFLHQGLGCMGMWRDFAEEVATACGCRALLYSRSGHGASVPADLPRDARFMHDEALHVFPEVLAQAGISDPILVGHSDGGSIALIHAGAPVGATVRGLVLEAPHVLVEDISLRSIARMKGEYETTDLKEKLTRYHGPNTEAMFRGWNDVWLSPAFADWNIEEYLEPIDCPVLVIQGEEDEYGTGRQVEAIVEQVSGDVQSILLPGCGHFPHRDRRETVVRAIAQFVRTTVGA